MILLAAIVLSWLGLVIHNVADLPEESIVSPVTSFPTLIYLIIAIGLVTPLRRVALWALLVWGLMHLIGGAVISVLPLPFLPFDPPQTLYHYGFHILYGIMQIPLLVVVVRLLRHRDRVAGGLPR